MQTPGTALLVEDDLRKGVRALIEAATTAGTPTPA